MIASVQTSVRTAAQFTGDDLAGLFRAVNVQACASPLADRYATLFYGVLDRVTLTLRYVNAGHNPPVVVHPDGSLDWLEPSGAPKKTADGNIQQASPPYLGRRFCF
jgi:sigma-B regulation protein RsbU (phosphoserine phosphatase)